MFSEKALSSYFGADVLNEQEFVFTQIIEFGEKVFVFYEDFFVALLLN